MEPLSRAQTALEQADLETAINLTLPAAEPGDSQPELAKHWFRRAQELGFIVSAEPWHE